MISKNAMTWSVDRIICAVELETDSDSAWMVLFSGLSRGMGGFVSAILQNGHAGRSMVRMEQGTDKFCLAIYRRGSAGLVK